MKRKFLTPIIILATIILFQSCHIQIENDRRIAISGTVVDGSGNPIPNINVRSEVNGEILGTSNSDENGNFEFVSLEAENYYGLNIVVNVKQYSYEDGDYYYGYDYGYGTGLPENSNYSGKRYFNSNSDRERSTYNLGQIQLNEPATLTLFLNNIPGDTNSLAYTFEYDSAVCQIDITGQNPEETCKIFNDYYNLLDANSTNTQISIESQRNSIVNFKYILNNEPEQTISIPLSNPENTYVFEY